jgi:hypothetical protein
VLLSRRCPCVGGFFTVVVVVVVVVVAVVGKVIEPTPTAPGIGVGGGAVVGMVYELPSSTTLPGEGN